MTREDLIAALEAATGPVRELDFTIAAAAGWPDSPYSHAHARRYTASIDAALSLVPDGWSWQVDNEGTVWLQHGLKSDDDRAVWFDPAVQLGRIVPPALAICTAALKAMGEKP